MMLTLPQFTEDLLNKGKRKHNIIFLGMSGTGKTRWSRLLAEKFNYDHFEVDELISGSDAFKDIVRGIGGQDEAEKLGKYFGRPWGDDFREKEKKYLAIEQEVMSRRFPPGSILDLTGSAIYHPEQMRKIAKTGLVIYLVVNGNDKKEMLHVYVKNPKPVCWNGNFNRKQDEGNEAALERCFSEMINEREKLYEEYADIKIPYGFLKGINDANEFVEHVKKKLRS